MPERAASGKVTAVRGPVLTYTGDPFKSGLEHTMVYEADAIVAMADKYRYKNPLILWGFSTISRSALQ